ncbi:MAG: phosphoheptose isomerase, partial [Bacteroidota bacterium]
MNTFAQATALLDRAGFRVTHRDLERPWGGFFVIDEEQAEAFIQHFFPEQDRTVLLEGGRLSPKLLVVAPNKRLSWQYHHRRAELWKVLDRSVGVVRSATDEPGELVRHA